MTDQKYKSELENSEGKKISVRDEEGRQWSGVVESVEGPDERTLVRVRVSEGSERNVPHDTYNPVPVYAVEDGRVYASYISGGELENSDIEELEVME